MSWARRFGQGSLAHGRDWSRAATNDWVSKSAVHRSHDHIDRPQNRHDVCHLVSLEDVGKDLQVVGVSGTDLEAPGCDVVIPLQEYADLAFA